MNDSGKTEDVRSTAEVVRLRPPQRFLVAVVLAVCVSISGMLAAAAVSAAGTHFIAPPTPGPTLPTPTPAAGQWVLVENSDGLKTWVWQPADQQNAVSPGQTATPIIVVIEPTACAFYATYVADVTIPDYTVLAPGQKFDKTWRMQNTGSCAWGSGTHFVFQEGDQLGAPASISVPSIAQGATTDITATMYAPQNAGTYRGIWQMYDAEGNPFGQRLTVVIQVPSPYPPTATPTPPPPPRQFSAKLVKWWPNCGSTGVKGRVEELGGSPVNGLRVRVWADGWEGNLSRVSGVGDTYGAGEWDVLLRQGQTGRFYAAVWDWQTGPDTYTRVESDVLELDFNYSQENCQPESDGHQWAEVKFIRNY